MRSLSIAKRAQKYLLTLPKKHARQLGEKIIALRENPHPQDCKQLRGYTYLRVDVGEYRIVYEFSATVLTVHIVGKRNDDDVYRQLRRLFG